METPEPHSDPQEKTESLEETKDAAASSPDLSGSAHLSPPAESKDAPAADSSDDSDFHAGFVTIIGEPNVGKSTLLNSLLGTKLSIVTPKPQTTRKRVLGIYTDNRMQIVFIDTPGILQPRYELHRAMLKIVQKSLKEVDAVLLLLDATRRELPIERLEQQLEMSLDQLGVPVIAAINKIDLLKNRRELLPMIHQLSQTGKIREVVPISAVTGENLDRLLDTLYQYLPQSPPLYDPELLSTHPERFFIAEFIREAVFLSTHEEIPYSTEVQLVEVKEKENNTWYIAANIIVERPSQKAILIGKDGSKIKEIGIKARQALEFHLGGKVYLDLHVKVQPKWRKNPQILRYYGYY